MSLSHALALAKCAFDRAVGRPWCVTPAVPILFFGNLAAYRTSPVRVLTVGLNPSLHEFPRDEPLRRFPLAEGSLDREPSGYLEAMSAYFRTAPYRAWFNAFEPLLNGMGASYYDDGASTALHTDICSPVATDPTWSRLDKTARAILEADGGPLWHVLLEELRPQIVVMSVARKHLERIEFAPLTDWRIIHSFERQADGNLRSRPYQLRTRWHDVSGEAALIAFGAAAQTPFGTLAASQKREAGERYLETYWDGR